MMLLALVFVLARNIIKLLVERRRAMPFVRFRAKLVFVLLGMTLIPAVLVLIVGSNVVLRGRRPVVQRAGGRGAVVGEPDRRRLLPGAAADRVANRRSRLARALAPATLTPATCVRSVSS